jgi:ligand-binding sensor domain-containing protein/serine phosphatase RsbU (regulator of sigma subunit)
MPVINSFKKQAIVFILLLLFKLTITFPLRAQNYYFDNYGIKQGLSVQKVNVLLQDSRDYIWLGTESGVSRFNGKSFENFTSYDNLSNGGVKSIVEDSLGYIWLGHLNGGGITRYDGRKFEQASFDSLRITGDITSIARIKNKIWFMSSSDGAIQADFPIKDIKHIKAKQFRGKDGLSDQVFGATVYSDGSLICITDAGVRRYNLKERKFENYRMPNLTTYFNTTCVLEDKAGNIWFGTYNGGLYKYAMTESKMVYYDLIKSGLTSNWITCITEDSRNRIWAGTWGGGAAVFEGEKIRKYDVTNGLKAARIYDIIEDKEGNILIADKDNGLTIYKGDAFSALNDKEILPDLNVNAICQDKMGAMWFGTNDGISKYYPDFPKKATVYNETENPALYDIRFIREDRDGNLWIGTNSGGVIFFNTKTSRFENQPYINSRLHSDLKVTALEIDKQNNLWIGTVEGVAVGTINQQNFERYTLLDSLTIFEISALYCDSDGNMWIGTQPRGVKTGLIKYNASNKHFNAVKAFSGISPITMVMDGKGALWIGTNEGVKAIRNDSIVSTITQDDGLLSNNINLLKVGSDGSIYIGSNSGLNRYFPESRRIISFTEKNGFTGIETKPNAVYESSGGDLWFGTANGAIKLIPEKLALREIDPLTHILDMQVNYKEHEMIEGMKLNYDERSLTFDYYSICLNNPDIVRFQVRLEGADADWQPVTDQTRAIYATLPPGKYTFQVKACNSQGIWNKEPVAFHFAIKPPFYLTWWFILTVMILIVLVIITYINIREKNLIKENLRLEAKVEERTAEVVQKSKIIEEKNRDITASIRYAERIQRAMLPRENTFDNTFVFYLPKDIVSGDFYWMYDNGDIQFIAAVDCTGHGVPGAFLSIIGHNSLNKVVRELGLVKPSEIVAQLDIEVMASLLQRYEKSITDGMDLALVAFNKKKFTLEFSGAYSPMYVVRKGEVFSFKGDRCAIGMTTIGKDKDFTNQVIDIQGGDMVYLCSDGYADQFGSADGKKFRSANVKRLLSEIWHLPVHEQKDRLEKEFFEWKGNSEQVDDVTFIGTRVPEN